MHFPSLFLHSQQNLGLLCLPGRLLGRTPCLDLPKSGKNRGSPPPSILAQNSLPRALFGPILGYPPSGGSAQPSLQCSANRRLIRFGRCSCNLAAQFRKSPISGCARAEAACGIARTTAGSYEAPVCGALQGSLGRAPGRGGP